VCSNVPVQWFVKFLSKQNSSLHVFVNLRSVITTVLNRRQNLLSMLVLLWTTDVEFWNTSKYKWPKNQSYLPLNFFSSCLMTAFVNETVVPLPPRSGVKVDRSPDWQTASVAFSSLHYTQKMRGHAHTTQGPGRL